MRKKWHSLYYQTSRYQEEKTSSEKYMYDLAENNFSEVTVETWITLD